MKTPVLLLLFAITFSQAISQVTLHKFSGGKETQPTTNPTWQMEIDKAYFDKNGTYHIILNYHTDPRNTIFIRNGKVSYDGTKLNLQFTDVLEEIIVIDNLGDFYKTYAIYYQIKGLEEDKKFKLRINGKRITDYGIVKPMPEPIVVPEPHDPWEPEPPEQQEDEIYQVAEEEATYPDGMRALMDFLDSTIVYPPSATMEAQGKVYVAFVIEKDGSTNSFEVLRGISDACDKEALRALKKMPKWNPAKNRGKVVRSKYVLPVFFRLE